LSKWDYDKIERTLGGLKFAVILILLFSLMMTIGTFLESYYGTEFANRTLYKRAPFMLLQFLMFICILFAAFVRFPPKKRYYGFYSIHTGLIMLACGSFITWYAGIDGHILLHPNEPTRQIYLDQDVVKINFPDEGLLAERRLPYKAFTTHLDQEYEGLKFARYYPYAESVLHWLEARNRLPSQEKALASITHSSHYQIFNENVSEEMIMSLHPEAVQFESSMSLGPLSLHYLPGPIAECFLLDNPSKLIIWNAQTRRCSSPEQDQISIQMTDSQNRFLVIPHEGQLYSFFPEYSPFPLSSDFNNVMRDSPLRLFNRALFEEEPHLFLFGHTAAYFDRDEKNWYLEKFEATQGKPISLPWMGLQVRLVDHQDHLVPRRMPEYTLPIQKNNEVIRGRERALEVQVLDQTFWVTNMEPLSLMVNGRKVEIYLTKETVQLPFEFVLDRFVMDTDPGTNNPASFESFVKLFTPKGQETHHIYMNNPLKHAGFTFYQASYSHDPETNMYSSTLSANVDQGRFLKYLGSIFLVFGSAWHYQITKKRRRLNPQSPLIPGISDDDDQTSPTA
jgi:hypothetical protein